MMKIKKGDKVICIKDYIFEGKYTIKSYSIGKQYEIVKVENDGESYYVEADMSIHDDLNCGLRFYYEKEIGNSKCFKNFFVTLAEWRDRQIDSILYED